MVSPVKVDANGAARNDDEPLQLEILNDSGNASEATLRPPEAEVDAVTTNNPGMAGEKYIEHFNITSWK